MGKKTESSRLNILYILFVLSNYSDEDHPMSISEIKDKVNKEFSYLFPNGDVISMDTVKRSLEELINKLFPVEMFDYNVEYRFGYYIHCVMKKEDQFFPYYIQEGKQPPKKYYYYESNLKTAELITLKDAIETYSFFSEEDITEIIRKIVKLRPQSFPKGKYYDVSKQERDENSLLLMNIEDLNRIIRNKTCARIMYCYYGIDKKLVPRPGYPKIVEPLHLIWSNGYYYLLAYNNKYQDVVSFRVDRITDIEEVEKENTYKMDTFDPVLYRHEHPVMYGGEKEKFILMCRDTGKNYIMNTLVDVFGKHTRVTQAPDEMIEKYAHCDPQVEKENGITWLKVVIETTAGGVEMWATQYCADCIIVSPKKSRDNVRKNLMKGMAYYN